MNQDTPDIDWAARAIAENVYAAFIRQATMPAAHLTEQNVLTRLVEAIRPRMARSSVSEIVAAANDALNVWMQNGPQIRRHRVETVHLVDGSVTMRPA